MQNGKNILVVDDDKGFTVLLEELLKADGHAVRCAETGDDAVRLSKEYDFDMVIIDYKMPGMMGHTACQLIRADRPHCLIVGLSGDPKAQEKFIHAGANTFVNKYELTKNFSLLNRLAASAPGSDKPRENP